MARITCGKVSSWVGQATAVRARRGGAGVAFEGRNAFDSTAAETLGRPWSARRKVWESSTSLDLGVVGDRPGDGCPSALSGRGGRLGRYSLIERVGQGRQADVWRAVSTGADAGEVALKVLPPSASARDPRRRVQLRREAERGARFTSPGLLPTYDYGEDGGTTFMAMPLVVGCSLAAILDQRRAIRDGRSVPGAHRLATAREPDYTREIVGLLARVACAADDAHGGRVAHRDIKPGNILVRRDHTSGVYLCDFGLARDLDVATASQLRDGAGSPLYMAPERLLKRPADEIRGDVFALGVTLFEALTLAPPVEVPPEMPSFHWARFLADAEPRRPSSLRPSIPPSLEATILRATARDPDQRHPTAGHLADDLERFLADGRGAHLPRKEPAAARS